MAQGEKQESGFAERFREVYEAAGSPSVLAFAHSCGIPEASARAYLAGASEPRMKAMKSIAEGAGVRLAWLVDGSGQMLDPEGRGILQHKGLVAEKREPIVALQGHEYVLVPRYDISTSAGHGAFVQNQAIVDYLAFKADWIRQDLGLAPADLALIRAKGDSMEPTIRDGDVLLVDLRTKHWAEDGIYIVSIDDRLMVKRVQFRVGGRLELLSDNKVYPPQVVTPSEVESVRIAGKVIWTGRRM